MNENPQSNYAWEDRLTWFKSSSGYRDLDRIDGEPMEFEWNIFPGFTTLQLCDKINNLLSSLGQSPEAFTGRILFMSMFNDISCDREGNKEECLANARVVKVLAKKFGVGQWSFIGPGSESTKERVERLSQRHIAALQQSSRVTVKIECNTRKIRWTDYLHVDVQRHLMEI